MAGSLRTRLGGRAQRSLQRGPRTNIDRDGARAYRTCRLPLACSTSAIFVELTCAGTQLCPPLSYCGVDTDAGSEREGATRPEIARASSRFIAQLSGQCARLTLSSRERRSLPRSPEKGELVQAPACPIAMGSAAEPAPSQAAGGLREEECWLSGARHGGGLAQCDVPLRGRRAHARQCVRGSCSASSSSLSYQYLSV